MKTSVTMGVKKPVVHSAPPLGRGLGAGQELRSPQEVSSHLEPGQRDRAGDVSTRHRCALKQFSDFANPCRDRMPVYHWGNDRNIPDLYQEISSRWSSPSRADPVLDDTTARYIRNSWSSYLLLTRHQDHAQGHQQHPDGMGEGELFLQEERTQQHDKNLINRTQCDDDGCITAFDSHREEQHANGTAHPAYQGT